jgi:hypothetical protein
MNNKLQTKEQANIIPENKKMKWERPFINEINVLMTMLAGGDGTDGADQAIS